MRLLWAGGGGYPDEVREGPVGQNTRRRPRLKYHHLLSVGDR